MINHPPVRIDEIPYTFEHLAPIGLVVDSRRAQKALAVRVSFTNHCYTTSHEPASHPAGWPILRDGGGRARIFCPERYALSRQMLPALIHRLNHPRVEVRQTQRRRNWVYGTLMDAGTGTYNVFFELRRSRERAHDLEMIVESAYARSESPGALGSIGFVLLCGKVYRGDPVATRR